jgi:hypothetical protein
MNHPTVTGTTTPAEFDPTGDDHGELTHRAFWWAVTTADLDEARLLSAAQTVLTCGRHGHLGNAEIAVALLRGWHRRTHHGTAPS